jgi:nitroreductase
MNDTVFDSCRTRRSVRSFTSQEVPDELIRELIDIAAHAPSACNKQDWRFIVVDEQDKKDRIVAAGGAVMIPKAPVGILVTYRNASRNKYYNDDVQSASAAIQNLLLAAHAKGLGACWICHLPTKSFLRRMFLIPRTYSPIAYILLGWPEKATKPVKRKHEVDDIMARNIFPSLPEDAQIPITRDRMERFLAFVYRNTPIFIKKNVLNRWLDKNLVRKFEN